MTAREVAYRVVRRVGEGAYADRALRAEAGRAGLTGVDRAFAQQLAYGTVQRQLTLDHVIGGLSDRPLGKIDPQLLDALRIGVQQLLFMDSVPDHAAVAHDRQAGQLLGVHALKLQPDGWWVGVGDCRRIAAPQPEAAMS